MEDDVNTLVARAAGGYTQNNPTNRNKLLEVLNMEGSRGIVAATKDGHPLANAFVDAGYRDHDDVLQAFLDRGMHVDIKNINLFTALMFASHSGQDKSIRLLLDHDADVNLQCKSGFTALLWACWSGFVKTMELLLEKNANPDIQNKERMTALMCASSDGRFEIVQLLLNHNADKELKNKDGKTALDLATNEEIKDLLRNHVCGDLQGETGTDGGSGRSVTNDENR